MNVGHLRTFAMVVEHRSFSAAAAALRISQPAVTMHIQALEADLGVTLLDRKYRRIELTEAGRVLLPHALAVLTELERAREEVQALSNGVAGHMLLAASTTPGQYVLPRILGSFLQANPEVSISISVSDTAEVVEAVESGRAHLGMVGARVSGAKVEFVPVGTDDLVMICPPNGPLCARESVTMAEAAELPFIMRESGSGTRQVAERLLSSAGIDPGDLHVVAELGTNEAILNAVEGGMGIGVVSMFVAEKAIQLGTAGLLRVGEFPVSRPLYMVLPRGTLTRAAEAFLAHVRDTLGHQGSTDTTMDT